MEGLARQKSGIDHAQTITGFNPTFARMLFNELKALEDVNNLYTIASEGQGIVTIKGAVCAYLNHLMNQVWGYDDGYRHDGNIINLVELERILADADRFLVTFEKK